MNPCLTRKQAYRRMPLRRPRRTEGDEPATYYSKDDLDINRCLEDDDSARVTRSQSWSHPEPKGQARAAQGPPGRPRKGVCFHSLVRVVLIPSYADFDQDTRQSVWYSSEDMTSFKRSAVEAFRAYGRAGVVAGAEAAEPAPQKTEVAAPPTQQRAPAHTLPPVDSRLGGCHPSSGAPPALPLVGMA